MCGIAGCVRLGDAGLVRSMTALMEHRGPDDCGIYEDGEVYLGHCRLSILDLSSAGRQPMASETGSVAITYNGEIYNFRELREELAKQGRSFRTGTDTEVILQAYEAYGLDFLNRIEGMFALALWDRRSGELILARDHIGIKPLFYFVRDGGLAFASELKPMLLIPSLEKRVSRRALRSTVRYASNYEDESLLQSVFKLQPGCVLVWKDSRICCRAYWRHPVPAPEPWSEDKLVPELQKRLSHAVQSHMVSDAPLGAALSGGLDSSGIVALMARGSDQQISTFTAGHGEDDPDLLNARIVAEHFRTNHHEVIVSAGNVADLLPKVVWHLEEPLGYPETVQMYLNYGEASKFVKVLLIGEGADECFGGYSRYKLLHPTLPVSAAVKRALYSRVYMHADEEPNGSLTRLATRIAWGSVPASPLPDPYPRAPMPPLKDGRLLIEQAINHDQRTYLPNMSLKRADAMGMAHSLELRVPFLDRRVVELSARIPAQQMIRRGWEKYILRRALAPMLPHAIAWRRKRPFQMRLNLGLADTLEYLCDRLLRPEDVRARGFFDPAKVEALRRGRPGRLAMPMAHNLWSWRVWSMLMCEVWARMFLDRPVRATPPAALAELL